MRDKESTGHPESFNVAEAKWYIVRVHSGSEEKIVTDIKNNALLYGVPKDDFVDFFVPSIAIETYKNKGKQILNKPIYPGYILVKMKMNEKSWLAVTKTNKVSGFLGGSKGRPAPITESEYESIVSNMEQGAAAMLSASNIKVGSRIKVKSGSFESFEGIVKTADEKSGLLTVSVSIFDRETTIELKVDQVEMVQQKN